MGGAVPCPELLNYAYLLSSLGTQPSHFSSPKMTIVSFVSLSSGQVG